MKKEDKLSYDKTEKNLKKFLKLGVTCNKKSQEFLEKWFKELKEDKERSKEILHTLLEFPIDEPIKIVKVIWEDANTMTGTSGYEDIKERGLLIAHTIGYLVYEDDKSIAICGFVFPDRYGEMIGENKMTAFRDVHIIPKVLIKNVIILKNDYEESRKFKEENEQLFVHKKQNRE